VALLQTWFSSTVRTWWKPVCWRRIWMSVLKAEAYESL
jgi:hypothetical protein